MRKGKKAHDMGTRAASADLARTLSLVPDKANGTNSVSKLSSPGHIVEAIASSAWNA